MLIFWVDPVSVRGGLVKVWIEQRGWQQSVHSLTCVMCLTGLQQRSFHIVHYGTRRRGCPLIDPVSFDKQHDIGEYCSLITMCFSWLFSACAIDICEFQCECCKGVRFPDRCSVDKLFPRACTASSSYSAVPWVTCQLCIVCCLTAVATMWSQWVFIPLQCSRVYKL